MIHINFCMVFDYWCVYVEEKKLCTYRKESTTASPPPAPTLMNSSINQSTTLKLGFIFACLSFSFPAQKSSLDLSDAAARERPGGRVLFENLCPPLLIWTAKISCLTPIRINLERGAHPHRRGVKNTLRGGSIPSTGTVRVGANINILDPESGNPVVRQR